MSTSSKHSGPHLKKTNDSGFTLIELMIVISIIAIILTLALPVYNNYTIRAKVGEALSIGAAAKTATSAACVEAPDMTALTNTKVGYNVVPTEYVANIEVQDSCSAPRIVLTTQNTGANPDVILTLNGVFTPESGSVSWVCTTANSFIFVPESCRS